MSDLVINVKQIANYPAIAQSSGTETLLLQQSGIGGPYASISSATLVGTALASSAVPLGVGIMPPSDTAPAATFTANDVHELNGAVFFNCYWTGSTIKNLMSGFAGRYAVDQSSGAYLWEIGAGTAGQPTALTTAMQLTQAGALSLPYGTITVARDPSTPMEVATLNYISNNTVASFNNRIGPVQLTASDVYSALGYVDYIATQPWTISAINAAIGNLITTYPLVTTWNGRLGDVYLTLSDITCVFFQPGQQPISPTPALTSNDNSIATTQWVTEYVTSEFSGSGQTLASQSWVLANTVNSFNTRQGPVTLTLADVLDVGAAPLNSPNFSGIPAAPTAVPGTSTAQVATTAFVQAALASSVAGVASFNTRTGAVVLTTADITGAGGAPIASPNLTGTPTAPTAAPGTNSTTIATTAYVANALSTGTVQSFNTRTGAVTLVLADVTGVGGAPTASPSFTGIPAAPTASPGTNTTQLATTGFVTAAITAAGGVSSFNSRTGAVTLTNNDITAAGGLSNPSANLTGTPTAPTATAGTNTNQVATTQFVQAAVAAGVTSFNTRTGAITLVAADITAAGGALLASPSLTGTPTAPTATAGTSNTQIATTQFVSAAIAANPGGVTSFNTRQGAVTLLLADVTGVGGAPIASPALTGVPTAPTAAPGTSTTQLATTAFVQAQLGSGVVTTFNGRTGAITLTNNDITAAGGATMVASDTAPTTSGVNGMWFDSVNLQTNILYNDGTSTQWVPLMNQPPSGIGEAPADGQVYGRNGQTASWSSVSATVAEATNNVGRNLVTNPTWIVAQRGAGSFTATNTAWTYTRDRWKISVGVSGEAFTMVRNPASDSDRAAVGDEALAYYETATFTGNAGAAARCILGQNIEGVRRLSNRQVTVSFYAIGSASQRVGINVTQNFGTGGSPSAAVAVNGQSVAVTGTWARYAVTLAIPSIAGMTLGTNGDDNTELHIWYSAGSSWSAQCGGVPVQSGTVNIWGIQLEYGNVVTPLDKGGTPQQILAECQRFYIASATWNIGGVAANTISIDVPIVFPVTMRASPTVTPSWGGGSGYSGGTAVTISYFGFTAQATGTGASFIANFTYTASADL